MKKFHKNLNRAIEVSKQSTFRRGRVGAVIADRSGNILAESYNIQKTHPMQKEFADKASQKHGDSNMSSKIFLHAEIAAIISLTRAFGDPHVIYVARTLQNGLPAIAKPCGICSIAIKEAGIKNIVYTEDSDDGFSYTVKEY